MTTSDDAVLDTNVLVNSLYEDSEHFAPSRALLDRAKERNAGFRLFPQNVAECYAALTNLNPRRVTVPKPPVEALAAVEAFLALPGITLMPVPTTLAQHLLALMRRRPVIGRKVYDLQLVAAMLGSGLRRIYTFNVDDFAPFGELEVLTPPAV